MNHLTEEERQGVAEGSLEPAPHLETCEECAADVDRIRRLMKLVRDSKSSPDADVPAELWPGIRSRIEQKKLVSMPGREGERARGREGRRWAIGGVVAAGLVAALWLGRGRVMPGDPANVAEVSDSGIALVALADSTHAYQEEAQQLLNHIELQRAMLRPEAKVALERDLKVIDVAIAELQDAIRNDPRNPALRRLLASSYRQKVDLLKRVSNASG
jgi:hypothetical protein